MPLNEFDIIKNYFTDIGPSGSGVLIGIGDDCALLQLDPSQQLVVSVDNLLIDRHFDANVPVADLAFKAVSVSVSDIASMGAKPRWVTLSLSLPKADKQWLSEFSRGLTEALDYYDIALVGGNITQGPINIATQLLGSVEPGKAIRRDRAQAGDLIFVTGYLGEAAFGLRLHQNALDLPGLSDDDKARLLAAWYKPRACPDLGQRLVDVANACIDISDGLVSDLQHILSASNVGARLQLSDIPMHPSLHAALQHDPEQLQRAFELSVTGGEDYQLCFTAAAANKDAVQAISEFTGIPIRCIGMVEEQRGMRVFYENALLNLNNEGYRHF